MHVSLLSVNLSGEMYYYLLAFEFVMYKFIKNTMFI